MFPDTKLPRPRSSSEVDYDSYNTIEAEVVLTALGRSQNFEVSNLYSDVPLRKMVSGPSYSNVAACGYCNSKLQAAIHRWVWRKPSRERRRRSLLQRISFYLSWPKIFWTCIETNFQALCTKIPARKLTAARVS